MGVTLKQLVKVTSTVSGSTTTFTTTAAINPGEDIIIAIGRANAGASTVGITGISTSAGAGTFERLATSCRASTVEVLLGRLHCTTLIPSGSTITVTHRSATAKRGGIMQVFSGLTSASANASSGNTADNTLGNISNGPNGSSASPSASTTGATSVPNALVIGAISEGGSNVYTEGAGFTRIDESRTTSGSADRGILLEYKVVAATGVQTATASIDTSGSWAAAVAALEIDTPVPSGPMFKEYDGTHWNALAAKEFDGSTWKTVNASEL